MNTTGKILSDINLIIESLLIHLKNKNQLQLLAEGNISVIQQKLYEIYSFDFRLKACVIDIVNAEIHPESREKVLTEFAAYKAALLEAEKICLKAQKDGILSRVKSAKGWVYCYIPPLEHSPAVGGRIYLNCVVESIPDVISYLLRKVKQEVIVNRTCSNCKKVQRPSTFICDYCGHYLPRVYPLSIKFVDSSTLRSNQIAEILRPDKVVLFIQAWPYTLQKIVGWMGELRTHFYTQVPLFATRMMKGIGYAPELTAEQKGLFKKDIGKESSFGNMICGLIARTICVWCRDKRRIPNKSEIVEMANFMYKNIFKERYQIEFELGMKE